MKNNSNSSAPVRWWDLPTALLFLSALLTTSFRLSATKWTEHLDLVQTVTVLGVIAGLAFGQSRFSSTVARMLAVAYGLFLIPWQLGLTLGLGIQWTERVASVGNRLSLTINQLFQQMPVTDNMFFLFLMSSLFWTLGVYGGYSLARYGTAWRAILPGGIALVIIHAYDAFFPVRTWFLAGYLFFALLLLARLNFLGQYRRWKQNRTYLPPYLGLDFIRTALVATAILVVFSWTAPALATAITPAESAWRRVSSPWISIRDRLSNAFSSLQASVGFVTDFYGDTLALGRGNPLSDTVVLEVQAPPLAPSGVRYYWGARVYDYYDGGWASTLPVTQDVTPDNFNLEFPEFSGRSNATFTIKTFHPIQNLYTPRQPVWASRPAEANLAINSDETIDLASLEARPYLAAGEVYQVEASLASATIAEMRAAGTDYPDWVVERYLQLPENITPRTRQLAEQLAAGLDNPYDIVQVITDYLRTNLKYSDTVPATPFGQEPIDWVLFDHREGFCNYYATAEIILLRSLGIPARLAVGYAQGERLSSDDVDVVTDFVPRGQNVPQEEIGFERDLYTVRHRDAHAWPEVFFPGLGWVEFEPTASQAPIFRPSGENPDGELANDDPAANEDEMARALQDSRDQIPPGDQSNLAGRLEAARASIPQAIWFLSAVMLLALAAVHIRRIRRERGSPPFPVQIESGLRRLGIEPPRILRRWARFASLSPLTRAYLELNRALSRLGARPARTDTPAERAARLSLLLPEARDLIEDLLVEYQSATYSPDPGNAETGQRAGREIRKISYLALLQRFIARFQEPNKALHPSA